MWINRIYEATLATLFSQFPAAVMTGPRQVGKTSLVRRIFPGLEYVSLDLPALAEQAEKSPHSFLSDRREPLIIDEIQYAPSLLRHLKVRIDEKKLPGRFILTGSQSFPLMQGVSESLAGRCGILNMLNLSAAEVREALDNFDENGYILKGGFPELYEKPGIDPQLWYASYLSTYLERDVRNILRVGNLRDFDRFLRAAAARTGQVLSYSELARDVGISPNTARQWISVLQASGQIFLLEPYHRNLGKRLIKSPKIYLCDTGLALFLMGFETWEAVSRHPVAGAIWETHVVMQVVKHCQSSGKMLPLWFWRTVQGAEVDLLVERAGRFFAVECKLSENPDPTTLKGILALKEFYGEDYFEKGLVACRTRHPFSLSEDVSAVPGSEIDLHLS